VALRQILAFGVCFGLSPIIFGSNFSEKNSSKGFYFPEKKKYLSGMTSQIAFLPLLFFCNEIRKLLKKIAKN
jgi:hypothetical protein